MLKAQTVADATGSDLKKVLMVLESSVFFPEFVSAKYLLQQLQIASFLGVMAIGATVVILLGHIDLSVPWIVGGAAIISTSLSNSA